LPTKPNHLVFASLSSLTEIDHKIVHNYLSNLANVQSAIESALCL